MGGKPSPAWDQENWQWWQDDAAEPTSNYANQNTPFTMPSNDIIIRLRINVAEINGGSQNNVDMKFEYSSDDSSFNTPGPTADWDYADGAATQGNTLTGFKLTDTDANGEYVEASGGAGTYDYSANENVEWDFAIQAGSNLQVNTTYYFRILLNDTEVVEVSSHPSLTTAAAAAQQATAQVASAILNAIDISKTIGQVSATAQVASAILNAINIVGNITQNKIAQVSSANLNAIDISSTLGAVSRIAQAALAALNSIDPSWSAIISAISQVATGALNAIDVSSSTGINRTANVAAANLNAVDISKTVGGVSRIASVATGLLNAISTSSTAGQADRTAQAAVAILNALNANGSIAGAPQSATAQTAAALFNALIASKTVSASRIANAATAYFNALNVSTFTGEPFYIDLKRISSYIKTAISQEQFIENTTNIQKLMRTDIKAREQN